MSEEHSNLGFLGKSYQFKLLYNIIWDTDFGRKVIPLIQSSYFDETYYKLLFSLMKGYDESNESAPNIDNLEQVINASVQDDVQKMMLLGHTKHLADLRKKYEKGEINADAKHIRDTLYKFVQQQEWKRVLAEAQMKLENGDLDTAQEIPDLLRSALLVGNNEDFGKDIFDVDEESFFTNEILDVIKTGIKPIDEIITGLPKGKLGMILAGQGIGKSKILTYLANEAHKQGKNVLHIVFDENTPEEIMKLHYAKWSGIEPDHFPQHKERVLKAKKLAQEKYRVGKLVIKRFSSDGTTIPKIKNWMKAYQDLYGIKFDMIVVDYIDEVESHKENKDTWSAQADVVKSLHSMLVDMDICGWTATQAKKESNDKRYLVFDDCGGSVAKLKKSQLVIAIGSDLTQKEQGMATFTLLKSNFSKCGHIFDDAVFNRGNLTINLQPSSSFLPPDLLVQGYDSEETVPAGNFKPVPQPVQSNLTPLSALATRSEFEDDIQAPTGLNSGSLDDLVNTLTFEE